MKTKDIQFKEDTTILIWCRLHCTSVCNSFTVLHASTERCILKGSNYWHDIDKTSCFIVIKNELELQIGRCRRWVDDASCEFLSFLPWCMKHNRIICQDVIKHVRIPFLTMNLIIFILNRKVCTYLRFRCRWYCFMI